MQKRDNRICFHAVLNPNSLQRFQFVDVTFTHSRIQENHRSMDSVCVLRVPVWVGDLHVEEDGKHRNGISSHLLLFADGVLLHGNGAGADQERTQAIVG